MKVSSAMAIIELLFISSSVHALNLRLSNGTVYNADDITVKEIEEVIVKDTEEIVLPAETIPLNATGYDNYDVFADILAETADILPSSEISNPIVLNTTFSEPEAPASDEIVTTTEKDVPTTTEEKPVPATEEKPAPVASEADKSIPEANTPPTQASSGGCGKGCIAAAVVCPIVGVFALVGIGLFIRRRRKRRRAEYDTAEAFDPVF